MQISEPIQQILVRIIVTVAVIVIIRMRIKSSKPRAGSCSKCDIDH